MRKLPEYHYVISTVAKPVYRYDFHSNHPLILGKNPGSKSIFLWYTCPNVSEKYGNNKVTLTYNNLTVPITIPNGVSEISGLSKYLNKQPSDEYNTLDEVFGKQTEKENSNAFRCK